MERHAKIERTPSQVSQAPISSFSVSPRVLANPVRASSTPAALTILRSPGVQTWVQRKNELNPSEDDISLHLCSVHSHSKTRSKAGFFPLILWKLTFFVCSSERQTAPQHKLILHRPPVVRTGSGVRPELETQPNPASCPPGSTQVGNWSWERGCGH